MKNKNDFMGVLLISIAVFLILNQFGLVTPGISGWNIVLGGFFVGLLIRGLQTKAFLGYSFR